MYKICHIEIAHINAMPRLWREAESAKKDGAEVVAIGEGDSTVVNGIRFIGFGKAAGRLNRIFIRSPQMVEAALETNPDIIQIHAPEFLLYVKKMKRAGVKVIFDSHECYAIQIRTKPYIPYVLRIFISFLYSRFERYICGKIDGVLYPCTINGKHWFGKRAKRVEKIENFSSQPDFFASTEIQKQAAAIYAGGLTRDRGVSNLITAIQKTSGKLILCGPAIDKECLADIEKAAQGPQVEYLGTIDRKRLFEQYAACSIGLSTLLPVGQYSVLDNMSTKIYEYMQCGLPTVFSNFPYPVKVNEQYKFGIAVDPEKPDEIAAAIQYLLDHPDEARQMGENGRNAVKKEFNWGVEEKKLLALYEKILNE